VLRRAFLQDVVDPPEKRIGNGFVACDLLAQHAVANIEPRSQRFYSAERGGGRTQELDGVPGAHKTVLLADRLPDR